MVSHLTSNSEKSHSEQMEHLYRRKNLVATYSAAKLLPPESSAFIRYRDDFVNRRVLDLGCGAGRLAIYLRPVVARYEGFDISPSMVEHCRRDFPGDHFVEGDVRDLSAFGNASFDSILAVSNLFDAVLHSERLQVLAEVRRILVPNGLLFFSAHNRNFVDAGQGPRLERHRNPVTQLRVLIDYWNASAHHRRLKPQQRWEDDFALLNDSGNNYASFHYYISRNAQLHQLTAAGFQPLECFDTRGRTLSATSDDADFPSLHYVARSITTRDTSG